MGIEATLEAIDLVRVGNPPKIVQDEAKATYEGWCNKKAAEIDWSRSVGEVYNLIRGCNPQPGAWTTINGETLQVFDSEKVDDGAFGRVGQVSAIGEDGMLVTVGRGAIRIKRVRYGSKKVTAQEFAEKVGLAVGAKLGT